MMIIDPFAFSSISLKNRHPFACNRGRSFFVHVAKPDPSCFMKMVEPFFSVGRFQLQRKRAELKRWGATFFSSHRNLFTVLWIVAFCSVFWWQQNIVVNPGFSLWGKSWSDRPLPKMRAFAFNLTDFDGVGDGVTVNTAAFETAVSVILKLGERGGGQLNVSPGKWLTAPFNLTSHMTLFLAEDAEILGIQV